jgi:antirestriction protein ArdC
MVTERIVKLLETGVVPWRRPWVNRGGAVNWLTQKPYRGINTMLLDPGEYATMKQINAAGGKVKKGEKSQIIVFWKWINFKDEETGEVSDEKIPLLRYYRVFEINTQCEGLESRRKQMEEFSHDPIEEAEKIVQGFAGTPPIRFAPGRAYYRPSADFISVPPIQDYGIPGEYYSTLFHEMVHSTGHPKRLNRPGVANFDTFGSEQYSKEELVAEMGAAMLCGMAGIDNSTIDNSVAYIGAWLRKLKDDAKLVIQAAGQAQKAADHILGISFQGIGETESDDAEAA